MGKSEITLDKGRFYSQYGHMISELTAAIDRLNAEIVVYEDRHLEGRRHAESDIRLVLDELQRLQTGELSALTRSKTA